MWLSRSRLVPVPVGWGSSHSTRSWSQAGPDGRGRSMFIPRAAGAQQGLKGGGLGGTCILASCGIGSGLAWTGGGDPGGHGSGGRAEGCVFWRGVGREAGGMGILACGSGAGLWPGAARGGESPAEWSSGSADLRGVDLAGGCSFSRLWCGDSFQDLSV
jgi:hypothetical protein